MLRLVPETYYLPPRPESWSHSRRPGKTYSVSLFNRHSAADKLSLECFGAEPDDAPKDKSFRRGCSHSSSPRSPLTQLLAFNGIQFFPGRLLAFTDPIGRIQRTCADNPLGSYPLYPRLDGLQFRDASSIDTFFPPFSTQVVWPGASQAPHRTRKLSRREDSRSYVTSLQS